MALTRGGQNSVFAITSTSQSPPRSPDEAALHSGAKPLRSALARLSLAYRSRSLYDCGRMIHPMIVEGQIAGGIAQGLGGALLEEFVYDNEAQLLTASLLDYPLPTSLDLPNVEISHIASASPLSPLGVKGIGEGGAIAAQAAVANAVADAIATRALALPRRRSARRLYGSCSNTSRRGQLITTDIPGAPERKPASEGHRISQPDRSPRHRDRTRPARFLHVWCVSRIRTQPDPERTQAGLAAARRAGRMEAARRN